MEESYNKDTSSTDNIKTSSTDSKNNPIATGDSKVQDGEGVTKQEEETKSYENSEEQEEYIDNANNNTQSGNTDPVQDGKGLTMSGSILFSDEDDDNDEDDDDGDVLTEVGDDPNETNKKIPIF